MPYKLASLELTITFKPSFLPPNVTDLINRIVQVLKEDLYWVRINTQNTGLIKPVKP